MITDDELIRLLEAADPALVDDPAPVVEPAEYRDALLRTPVTLVDREPAPTQPTSGRRWPILLAAAAAVVAIVFVASSNVDVETPTDEPSPTVIVPPTLPPRALPNDYELLVPGTYFVDEVSGIPTPRIFATIGDGWWGVADGGWYTEKREHLPASQDTPDPLDGLIGVMRFSHPIAVVSDACHWAEGYYAGSVATLNGVVAALTEQQGWAKVTAPTDISIDGYAGKAFQRTAPANIPDCDLSMRNSKNDVRTWQTGLGSWTTGPEPVSFGYGAGDIETLWVLDIDGTVVIINTVVTPGPPSAGSPDFAADVLDSIRIERT